MQQHCISCLPSGDSLNDCLCSAKRQGRVLSCHTLHDHVRGAYTLVSNRRCCKCHSVDDVKHVWHLVVQGQLPLIVLFPTFVCCVELVPAEPPEDHLVFPAQSGDFFQLGRPLVFPVDSLSWLSQQLPQSWPKLSQTPLVLLQAAVWYPGMCVVGILQPQGWLWLPSLLAASVVSR